MGAERVPLADDHGGRPGRRGGTAGADGAANLPVADAAERRGGVGVEKEWDVDGGPRW